MRDNKLGKEEIMMIMKAYEELLALDRALSNAFDGSGIEDGGKYRNLWNLPMVLMKYSRFKDEEALELFSVFHDQNLSIEEKFDRIM